VSADGDSSTSADESQKERRDRELLELLNELRVALPGIQVLFAFLLTMPFTQRFNSVTSPQRTVYFVAFICTAVASILLIAPTVLHRLRFRSADKEALLWTSNRLAVVGTFLMAVAIVAVVFVITDILYKGPLSAVVAASAAVLVMGVWYLLPLRWKALERS
jgi:predicted neutral ceramidase superfamily lipid hydrolase